ncbi:MAG: antibiotic biosynthesis monooxygenase [Thioalkalivibrio sp.]|nr:antibiotic biosynthesis monooxygenase [Thioalkalivibrio sp.]
MSQLQVTARLAIHDGKLDEFKEVAAKCMQIVRSQDSGTLQYDWFLSADQTECVVREAYRDSAAVLEHVANLGELFGALLAVSDFDVEIFGSPSAELVEATAALAPRVFSPLQSMSAAGAGV